MPNLTRENFKGIKLNKLNNYIKLINEKIKVNLKESPSWLGSVSNLLKFLNDNNFAQYEGYDINDKSLTSFINRINKPNPLGKSPQIINNLENKNDKLKFFPINKMTNRPKSKKGMDALQHIVLDLYRDVVRVKNAISPAGAADIVAKHNAKANPGSRWRLAKRDPSGEDVLDNMPDVNNDGIPDVIIQNANGDPMYVNGYTTKRSDYPETLAYYLAHPTRASRKGYPKSKFLDDELYKPQIVDEYDSQNGGGAVMGDIKYTKPFFYDQAKENYKLRKISNRLSPYRRFQKYVVQDFLATTLDNMGFNEENKFRFAGPLLAKVTGHYWNFLVVSPLAERFNVPENQLEKFKKSNQFKQKADEEVTNIINRMRDDGEFVQTIEQDFDSVVPEFARALGWQE